MFLTPKKPNCRRREKSFFNSCDHCPFSCQFRRNSAGTGPLVFIVHHTVAKNHHPSGLTEESIRARAGQEEGNEREERQGVLQSMRKCVGSSPAVGGRSALLCLHRGAHGGGLIVVGLTFIGSSNFTEDPLFLKRIIHCVLCLFASASKRGGGGGCCSFILGEVR